MHHSLLARDKHFKFGMLFLSGWFIYVCLMCPLIMSHCNAFLTLRSLWDLNENTWKATKYRILKFVRVIALHWELQLELRPWPPIDSDTKLCEMYEFMAEGNTSNGQRRASLPLCSPPGYGQALHYGGCLFWHCKRQKCFTELPRPNES